jgi:hypothetical protein
MVAGRRAAGLGVPFLASYDSLSPADSSSGKRVEMRTRNKTRMRRSHKSDDTPPPSFVARQSEAECRFNDE